METAVQTKPESPSFETFWAGMQELRESQRKTARVVREVSRQMGDLHSRFGEMAMHLVAPGIVKRFNELGYHFDGITNGNFKIIDEQTLKPKAEVDLVLENGDCIIAVEIKVKPLLKDVEQHLKRLEILREYKNKRHDYRKIRGAIAGAIFGPTEKEAVAKAGLYVIEQSGDTMRINIPDNFAPRDW